MDYPLRWLISTGMGVFFTTGLLASEPRPTVMMASPGDSSVVRENYQVTPHHKDIDSKKTLICLNREERSDLRVRINSKRELYSRKYGRLEGRFLFFLNREGKLYVASPLLERASHDLPGGRFWHSSFEGTQSSCATAGEIWFRNSKRTGKQKVSLNNDSGHYKPLEHSLLQVVETLTHMGFTGSVKVIAGF